MKVKLRGILTLFLALVVQISFAQEKTISGTVSDDSGALPGVSIIIKGTSTGTETDFNGKYSIKTKAGDVLSFSYLGYVTVEKIVGVSNTIDVTLEADDNVLDEVVVTALGIKKSEKSLAYASQTVKAEELTAVREVNLVDALAGKVAGVQVRTQAGSKLGSNGAIRIRGALGLSDDSALFVVDGVPGINLQDINMDDVATINVLKGPSATSLYGQRAQGGVVIITTMSGKSGEEKYKVSFSSTTEFDSVDITADFQNTYGGGVDDTWNTYIYTPSHPIEWKSFEGKRYHDFTDDASWGPKFDGEEYLPWYAFYPGTSRSGQTANFTSKPNNIRDFYDNALNLVNNLSIEKSGKGYSGRLSYTNRNITGIIPGTALDKHQFSINLNLELTEKLKSSVSLNVSNTKILGEFEDDYATNNISARSFNQWFHRDIDTKILRELNVVSGNGRIPAWNLSANPTTKASTEDITTGNYWVNPYSFHSDKETLVTRENIYGNVSLEYDITDNLSVKGTFNRRALARLYEDKLPTVLEISASQDGLKNSYYKDFERSIENNYEMRINFNKKFGKIGTDIYAGGNIRDNFYENLRGGTEDGFIIPDFYELANSVTKASPTEYTAKKQVRSLWVRASFDYNDLIFVEGSVRNDLSSALPNDSNGYTYPSIGTSFIFSELLKERFSFLTFGKLRLGWAQIGSDIGAYALTSSFGSSTPYDGNNPSLNVSNSLVDPNIVVPLNESFEIGTDLRFFDNRLNVNYTYFDETKKDEVQYVSISPTSGYSSYLTNAGSFQRKGHELTLSGKIIKSSDFSWDATLNYSQTKSTVLKVNEQVDEISVRGYWATFYFTHTGERFEEKDGKKVKVAGKEWGQIKGTRYKRINGQKVINANGSYQVEKDHYFGSVLPDFLGGFSSVLRYKNLSLSASVDFQKGGLFYSLSSMWGTYSGLYAETAAVNDKGKNVRDAVADGGGVKIEGVDENGKPLTVYRNAQSHFHDLFSKRLTEKFLFDASYIKLREVTLTYKFSDKLLKKLGMFDNISLSIYGKNLGLLYKDADNPHVDPSIISRNFGEYGQQPGTKTIGTSLKLTF